MENFPAKRRCTWLECFAQDVAHKKPTYLHWEHQDMCLKDKMTTLQVFGFEEMRSYEFHPSSNELLINKSLFCASLEDYR